MAVAAGHTRGLFRLAELYALTGASSSGHLPYHESRSARAGLARWADSAPHRRDHGRQRTLGSGEGSPPQSGASGGDEGSPRGHRRVRRGRSGDPHAICLLDGQLAKTRGGDSRSDGAPPALCRAGEGRTSRDGRRGSGSGRPLADGRGHAECGSRDPGGDARRGENASQPHGLLLGPGGYPRCCPRARGGA